MEKLIPLITHLPPPDRFRLVQLNRWAPMFEQAETLGVTNLRPAPYYQYVYPFDSRSIANLAAYFDYGYIAPQPVDDYAGGVQTAVRNWKDVHQTDGGLYAAQDGEKTLIWDRRPVARFAGYTLEGLTRFLHDACDEIRTVNQLTRLAMESGFDDVSAEEILDVLAALEDRLLMIHEENRYLSLAVQVTDPVDLDLVRAEVLGRLRAGCGVQQAA
jgi:hypothetical protein